MTEARLAAFLRALPDAPDDVLCSPPGIGGLWKAKHIRSGMKRGLVVVHNSGLGLAFVIPAAHGVCKHCASRRDNTCTHCNCSMCVWEREVAERDSPPVNPERWRELRERFRNFEVGRKKPLDIL